MLPRDDDDDDNDDDDVANEEEEQAQEQEQEDYYYQQQPPHSSGGEEKEKEEGGGTAIRDAPMWWWWRRLHPLIRAWLYATVCLLAAHLRGCVVLAPCLLLLHDPHTATDPRISVGSVLSSGALLLLLPPQQQPPHHEDEASTTTFFWFWMGAVLALAWAVLGVVHLRLFAARRTPTSMHALAAAMAVGMALAAATTMSAAEFIAVFMLLYARTGAFAGLVALHPGQQQQQQRTPLLLRTAFVRYGAVLLAPNALALLVAATVLLGFGAGRRADGLLLVLGWDVPAPTAAAAAAPSGPSPATRAPPQRPIASAMGNQAMAARMLLLVPPHHQHLPPMMPAPAPAASHHHHPLIVDSLDVNEAFRLARAQYQLDKNV